MTLHCWQSRYEECFSKGDKLAVGDPSEFITRPFLRSIWAEDFERFKDTDEERTLLTTLENWAARNAAGEVRDENGLMSNIFGALWGYIEVGANQAGEFSIDPQFRVQGAGPNGGAGAADAGLGFFGHEGIPDTLQIACEFKGLDTDLDAPQQGRADKRSPAEQCLNYLVCARRGMTGNEAITPRWGIVTDMNVFRLYWYDRAPSEYLEFNIEQRSLLQGTGMLGDDEESRFERYLFKRLFHAETLLSKGQKPELEQLISRAWIRARELENAFYQEYRAYREHLFQALIEANPNFAGTRGRLVRLAQKVLDRSIFVFFCEDMGRALGYPPQLLRDLLIHRSIDQYFNPDGFTIWRELCDLFAAMNEGRAFGGHALNQFNGGLFAPDPELDELNIPNRLFCIAGQGHNEASLYQNELTLLYLSASYNYASDIGSAVVADDQDGDEQQTAIPAANAKKADPSTALGLYTLGRIFEQSITELEILEAEADGRVSVNKESKRKRDGVYYTPEWVVERIVRETVGRRLADFKEEAGWDFDANGRASTDSEEALDVYQRRLEQIKILDPACGSGAFLISTLKFLLNEWSTVRELRRRITGDRMVRDEDELIRDVLQNNLYGVDINPTSVEITQLALWLHTARGDRPLSTLSHHIRDGNSLIDDRFWLGQVDLDLDDAEELERINTFNWEESFPEVFGEEGQGGFDVVLGNPPYVKLQNFRKAHPDMAEYLRKGREGTEWTGYASAATGNFDLYIPFIEKGLELLKPEGRMGYIAPSVWVLNEYGAALRDVIYDQRSLVSWLDFKSHQIFEEATVYTALQFFRKGARVESLRVANAPDGIVVDDPWLDDTTELTYLNLPYADRWLMLSGRERAFIDRLYETYSKLSDERVSDAIFVGIQTSADKIYQLKRVAPGRYISRASDNAEVALEDDLLKPLISGDEAKRYEDPTTDTFLLFPYRSGENGCALIPEDTMENEYPLIWNYLKSHEADLRKRESNKMDRDDSWWAYNYPKNLEKQSSAKVIVPRLVTRLKASVDDAGLFYLDNVDAGGVSPAEGVEPFFLAAVLNGSVANYVFRRISKPFRGDFLSANKQFIAPLPIPTLDIAAQEPISRNAVRLQRLHTEMRTAQAALSHRLQSTPASLRVLNWVFPMIADRDDARELETAQYVELNKRLHSEAEFLAICRDGELKLQIDGADAISGIFLDNAEGELIAAQWNAKCSSFKPSGKDPAKKLVTDLRRLIATTNQALIDQILNYQADIERLQREIVELEEATDQLLFAAYELTPEEIRMVRAG
ncbi:Eco57I restriction-modification methylase domain-containing protein [Pontixanthobacter aestiaquae]|uniref:site-specific DNA-methyltransferase (adenine-specific) n=1 Tax=Pontixanthobacter aestiaquae TaxID=1509367 RepID=A0A844Z532_9SPHN|nr:DNA methyltransferase [Pontixanthobacter aestiaquae]MDN3646811.1 Eco57I restriction-modification methylase domain-containing protein [Pontixanthobacter aestiaquae]MXO82207.1 N-6 DNA methylase [Pontixanthobacter aestiaquae]